VRSGHAGIEGNHDRETDAACPKHDAKPSAAKPSGAQHWSEEADPSTRAAVVRRDSVAAVVSHVLAATVATVDGRGNCFGRVARHAVVSVVPNRVGTVDLAAAVTKLGETVSGCGVAALVRAGKGFLGLGQVVLRIQQDGELECAVDVSAVVGATICGGGAGDVAALFEEQAEVVSGGGVAGLVCAG
jgi:hypothetical protein